VSGRDFEIAQAALAKAGEHLEDARIAAHKARENETGERMEVAQAEPEKAPKGEKIKPEGLSAEVLAALNQTESEKLARVAQAERENMPKGQKISREDLPEEAASYLADAEKGGQSNPLFVSEGDSVGTYQFVNARYIVDGKPVKEEQYVAAVKANEDAAKNGGEQIRVKRVFDVYFDPMETTQRIAAVPKQESSKKKKG
jgi:hypothetical protein